MGPPANGKTATADAGGDLLHFDPACVVSAATLVEEGKRILAEGVRHVVDGVLPDYGMAGFIVGYAKVGKSTFGTILAGAVGRGDQEFLGRRITKRRVLYLALEDPREYMAWMMARSLSGDEDLIVYPKNLILDDTTLADLERYVSDHDIGLVYLATFMAGVRGLVRDENDNAGMTVVVERIKQFARRIGKPVLIEAHSGRNEDLAADADPVKALRGASAAAASADFVLSLKREGRGGFSTKRVLSGSGRFVTVPPIRFDYDPTTGRLTHLGDRDDAAAIEADWGVIVEKGALTGEWQSVSAIARAAGFPDKGGGRDRVRRALAGREGVEQRAGPLRGRGERTEFRLRPEGAK